MARSGSTKDSHSTSEIISLIDLIRDLAKDLGKLIHSRQVRRVIRVEFKYRHTVTLGNHSLL